MFRLDSGAADQSRNWHTPEVPDTEAGRVRCDGKKVPVRRVRGGAGQLRGRPGQAAHGTVLGREVQQQLHAHCLLPAGLGGWAAQAARRCFLQPPAGHRAIPAPCLPCAKSLFIAQAWPRLQPGVWRAQPSHACVLCQARQ